MEATIKASTPPLLAMEKVGAPNDSLSALENTLQISTPPLLATKNDTKLLQLMDWPLEVRNKILGHLLPNALEIKLPEFCGVNKVWDREIYRPGNEACHTTVLRSNHQLYTEGTAILYNRAFRVMMTRQGLTFLRRLYSWTELYNPSYTEYWSGPNQIFTFRFHRVKQIQIEL